MLVEEGFAALAVVNVAKKVEVMVQKVYIVLVSAPFTLGGLLTQLSNIRKTLHFR